MMYQQHRTRVALVRAASAFDLVRRLPRRTMRLAALLCCTAALLLLSTGTAVAAGIVVDGGGDAGAGCTLREAIASANTDTSVGDCTAGSGADIITFSVPPASTITLTGGELPLTSTLTIDGGGVITVSGGNLSRIFNIGSSGVVTLTGLTIRDGYTADNGGGIFNAGGSVTLSSSTVVSNSSSFSGGGIYNQSAGRVTLASSSVVANSAGTSGGGIFSTDSGSAISITASSRVQDNNAGSGGGGITNSSAGRLTLSASSVLSNSAPAGGGIYNVGSVISMTASSLVQGNSASFGGGIFNTFDANAGNVTLSASSVMSNSASNDGGGIYNYGSVISITGNSLVQGNGSSNGGGIYNQSLGVMSAGSVMLAASRVVSNSAGSNGGGIYNQSSGSVTLIDSDVVSNSAGSNGGGIFNTGSGSVISITASSILSNSASNDGGGIYNTSAGNVTLLASSVMSNSAGSDGGGVFSTVALRLTDVVVQSNRATGLGGGLYTESTLSMTNTHLISNTATSQGGGASAFGAVMAVDSRFENNASTGSSGGGLHAWSTLVMTNTQFLSNTATSQGGGAFVNGAITAADSRFENNRSTASAGGGLHGSSMLLTNTHFLSNTAFGNGGGAVVNSASTIVNSRFENNQSTNNNGGAIYVQTGVQVEGALFLRNRASLNGGAIYFDGLGSGASTERMVNVLMAGNRANGQGNAIYARHENNDDTLTILYTTIASPTLAGGAAVVLEQGTAHITDTIIVSHTTGIQRTGGVTVTQDYNLFFGNTNNTVGTVGGGANSVSGDPAFVDPAADDYQLTAASAAIDRGVDAGVATDFFGDVRPQGAGFDIGYDESPFIGNFACYATPDDGATLFASDDAQSVRAAVAAAGAGGTVKIAGYCAGAVFDSGDTQVARIDKTLTLAGGYTTTNWITSDPAANPTTLDALGGGRVLLITGAISVTVEHLRLTGGLKGNGGGIHNTGAATTISNTLVYSNSATNNGGGIWNGAAGSMTLNASSVTSNSATGNGGGIFNESAGGVTLSASSVVSNSAVLNGGGIFNDQVMMILAASTVAANSAGIGGGIYNIGASAAVTIAENSLVQENVAATFGGGLHIAGGIVMLDHSGILSNVITAQGFTSQGGGAYINGGAMTITNNSLIQNNATGDDAGAGAGVIVINGALTVEESAFLSNGPGRGGAIHHGNGPLSITGSCIVGNSDTALDAYLPVTATGNWWGHVSGPSGAGPGIGDSVTSSVDFSDFLNAAILGCPTLADAEVAIAKSVEPALAAPGGSITYTLAFSNTGARFARNVVISDSIPLSVTITGVTSSTFGGGVFITQTSGSPDFAWTVSDLAVGAGGYITLTGTVAGDAWTGLVITNTTAITASGDGGAGNNSSSAEVTVVQINVFPTQPGVAPNGSVTISATVRPAIAGLTVNFAMLSGFDGLSSYSAATDANGVATVQYTAGGSAEVVQVEGALAVAPDVRDRGILYVASATVAGAIATATGDPFTAGNLSPNHVVITKTGAGTPPIGWAEFDGNPCPAAAPGSRIVSPYVDVMVDDATDVTEIVVTLRFTATAQAAQHKLFWCNLGAWQQVTGTVSIDTVLETLTFTITGATTPALFQLEGTPFVGVGSVPTAATVGDFVAAEQGDRVSLTWQTLNEIGLTGFHLYRGLDAAGPGERITGDPLPSQGAGGLEGFAYAYDDFTPRPSETAVFYWLEELHSSGEVFRHGPQRIGSAGSLRVFLPAISQGSAMAAEPPAVDADAVAAGDDAVEPASAAALPAEDAGGPAAADEAAPAAPAEASGDPADAGAATLLNYLPMLFGESE